MQFDQAGVYQVSVELATPHSGGMYVVEIGKQAIAAKARPTGDWDKFQGVAAGRVEVKCPVACRY